MVVAVARGVWAGRVDPEPYVVSLSVTGKSSVANNATTSVSPAGRDTMMLAGKGVGRWMDGWIHWCIT